MPKALTINKDDKQFDAFPSYEELRKLGIDHISSFSGELWTDHNIHDPGITMLEVLCYALTDLGYRTSLNISDLLAPDKDNTSPENNFFTPEEILTCNPLTITDIRRMLVDIEGVRNAWVIPSTDQEVELFFQDCEQELSLQKPATAVDANCPTQDLKLKGLYRVLLDVDPLLTSEEKDCDQASSTISTILQAVKKRLYNHRNLCEDFQEIKILNDEEIAVCADLELAPDANPETVLLLVYEAIEALISPRLPFYSLEELLKNGRSIEQIYQGRPYTRSYENGSEDKFSHGFVDIEVLKKMQLPRVLYASDFYRVIMDVEGVRAIKQLSLNNFLGGNQQTAGEEWALPLTLDHRPVFSPDLSQFKFFKGVLRVPSQGTASARERFRKRLADFRKIKYEAKDLDGKIPYGRHRDDLGSYYSVQHEFPTAYGIGEGDLSSDAPAERQAQALQLKGYLSFFDQLLANYCSQLANIRNLFALSKSSNDERKTYFGQLVENIPQLEKLLRFYDSTNEDNTSIHLVLANNNYSFGHPVERDLALQQLINELTAFDARDIEQRIVIKKEETEDVYSFSINDTKGIPLLTSNNTYCSETEAKQAIQSVLFMGIIHNNYEKINLPAEHCYSFRLMEDPSSYSSFLQQIIESPESYLQRRDLFLNHLLARFGEQFTEYVLLMYALNQEQQDLATIVSDKERFLSNYPAISRNRGRAFNYTLDQELWDSSTNLSGLENRVSQLMGLANWERSTLNPFKVELRDQACYLEIRDHRNRLIFRSTHTFTDKTADAEVAPQIQALLCTPEAYRKTNCSNNSIYGFELIDEGGKLLGHFPRTYASPELRDEHLECTLAYFCEPLGITRVITQQRDTFGFRLEGKNGEVLLINKDDYDQLKKAEGTKGAEGAEDAAKAIIDKLRSDAKPKFANSPNSKQRGYGIQVGDDAVYPEIFTDTLAQNSTSNYLKTYFDGLLSHPEGIAMQLISQEEGWYYQLLHTDTAKGIYLQSSHSYPTKPAACNAFKRLIDLPVNEETYRISTGSFNGGNHSFRVVDGEEELAHHPMGYPNPRKRNRLLKKVKTYVSERGLHYDIRQDSKAYYWCAGAPDSKMILQNIMAFQSEAAALDTWQQLWETISDINNYKLYPINDQWQVILKRDDGLKIAQSNPYDRKKDLRKDLKAWFAHWQPLAGRRPEIEERDGKYYFVLTFEDKDALIGCQRYDNYAAADCAALHFSQLAISEEVYEMYEEEGTCRYGFGIKQDEEWIALHPTYRIDTEQAEYIVTLRQHILDHYFPFDLRLLAGNWHFEIRWENCRGRWETLIVENGNHPTEVAAKAAANRFLGQWKSGDITIDQSGEEGDYSLVFKYDDAVLATHTAIPPERYETLEELESIRLAIVQYLDHYKQLCSGEIELFQASDLHWICGKSHSVCKPPESSGIESTDNSPSQETGILADYEPTGKDCLLSGYRLQKDEHPIATHPAHYHSAEERNTAKNELYELARFGEFSYTELCRSGSQLIKKVGKRYYYHWHKFISGDENQLLWRSVKAYETEEEARAAFKAEWPKLMVLAKNEAAYVHPTEEFPYLGLQRKDKVVLYYPEQIGAFELETSKQDRIKFARGYPLFEKDGLFKFQLFELEDDQVIWAGTSSYKTADEAWQGFLSMLSVATYEGNYRCQDDQACNIYEMALVETLLVSRRTYADELIAFETTSTGDETGGDKPKIVPLPTNFTTLLSPLQDRFTLNIGEQPEDISGTPNFNWQSITAFNSHQEASVTVRNYQQLINDQRNFIYTNNPETNTLTAYAFTSVSPRSTSGKPPEETNEDRAYHICPAEYHEDTYQIDKNIQIGVSKFCEKNPPANIETICPKAWDIGLEEFLIYGTNKANYYTYLEHQSCQYSFRVVTDKYRLARFPQEMHTPREREALLDWLYHYSACVKDAIKQPYLQQDALFILNGKCYFKLYYQTGNGDIIHWRSYANYQDEGAVNEAIRDHLLLLRLLSLAQQPDCYELLEVATLEGEAQQYQLALINDQGEYVLISTEVFTEDTYEDAMRERIMYARRYPFYEYKGQFGFQCYSTENIPDFTLEDASNCLEDSIPKVAEGITFASTAGTIDLKIEGVVIWENIHDYDSLIDAECAFNCFEKLLDDRLNYQGRRLSDCNLFGVELTHPHEVLAEHPASYATETAVENAIDKTLACVNKEGFHLLEHILLRPKQGGSGEYSIRFRYPEFSNDGDDLCYTYNNAPLLGEDITYSDKATAEADKALFWEALNNKLDSYPTTAISTRTQLAQELQRCLKTIDIDIPLFSEHTPKLMKAIACIEDRFQYFNNPFISPCKKDDGYYWRIRSADETGIPQEISVGPSGFISLADAEEALEELLIGLDQAYETQDPSLEERRIFIHNYLAEAVLSTNEEVLLFSNDEELNLVVEAFLKWDLKDVFFCFSRSPVEAADALMPTCPDCENTVGLSSEKPDEDACSWRELPLPKAEANEEETKTSFAPGTELYVPGADPYSFWATVVLPYWPQRFQNINFRKFFEDTLRRETPAHIALRICWLDPKQMYHFDRYYRDWLEANSGQGECLLQDAKKCLIDILFNMSTVYPPARLQGGDCASGSNEVGAILLDATQLG